MQDIWDGVRALSEAGYLFTYEDGNPQNKRMTDFHQIITCLGELPSSILLGAMFCKKEWRIYERNRFHNEGDYKVVSVPEFLANYTEFEPQAYKRASEWF